MTNQTGFTEDGDVVQPARDYIHYDQRKHYHSPKFDVDNHEDGDDSSGSGSSGAAAASGGGVGVVVAIGIVIYLIFGGDEPFPTRSDTWPAEVKHEAIAKTVGDWLDRCIKSASSKPANCPQSIVETSGVSDLKWTFYGNPLETSVINFNQAESRFDMLGTVVVAADYVVSKEKHHVVTPITYWAVVKWAEGKLDTQLIKSHSSIGDPEVTKQDPNLGWDIQATKLREAFSRCVGEATSAMPTGCPIWKPPYGAEHVKWSSTGDPTLTARSVFDSKFGIYRVKGTYGIDVQYTTIGTAKSENRNPTYEALIAPTATGPVVLQILDTSTA